MIGNQSAKFQLNLPNQTTVTELLWGHPKTFQFLVCEWRLPQRPETEVLWVDLTKADVTIVYISRFS